MRVNLKTKAFQKFLIIDTINGNDGDDSNFFKMVAFKTMDLYLSYYVNYNGSIRTNKQATRE